MALGRGRKGWGPFPGAVIAHQIRRALLVEQEAGAAMFVGMIFHLAFLIALSALSGFVTQWWSHRPRAAAFLQGLLFGGVAVLGMLNPLVIGPGIILDGRSVLLSLAAYFFGPWAAIPAMLGCILCRLAIGGGGAVTGVLVILASAGIGLRARDWADPDRDRIRMRFLFAMALAVHVAMLLLFLTLPAARAIDTIMEVSLPVLLLYPLATVVAGRVLADQLSVRRLVGSLQRANRDLDATLQSLGEAILATGPDGRIMRMNRVAEEMTGWSMEDALGRRLDEVCLFVEENSGELAGRWDPTELESPSGEESPVRLVRSRDGTERVVALRLNRIQEEAGESGGVVLALADVTRARQATEALRQSEERLRLALAAARQGLYDLDLRTGEFVVTPEYARMLGFDPEGFRETTAAWIERLHPDDWERVSRGFLDYIDGNAVEFRSEFRQRAQDGSWKWILSLGEITQRGSDGTPWRLLGTHTDITDRREMEEELVRRNALLVALINSQDDLTVFSVDRNYRYTCFNEKHRREAKARWEVDLEVGQSLLDCLPASERASMRRSIDRALAGDTFTELHHPEGGDAYFELSWSPIQGGSRNIDGVAVFIRDVSEARRLQRQLQLQGTALESVANSVVITDAEGSIQWVNPAFCRISGYAFEEVVGQTPRLLKSGQQRPETYAELWATIKSGRPWRGEFVNRRKDGSLFREDVTVTPVLDDDGEITHFVAIKQDLSELAKSLDELEAAYALVAEQNRTLDHALVAARAAAEAKATFLATMSHELRTPMNGVIGMTSLLRETEPLTAEQVDCIETIRSSGQALLGLINDVLDFSKIDAGRFEIETRPFDPRACIEEVLETVAPLAREKGLELAADLDFSESGCVLGDGARLRQVLTNLVGNAVKFTNEGEVVVEARSTTAAGRHGIRFAVHDTGVGIPADRIDQLFEPFSQIDSSATRTHGGTGLGLAISHRLVAAMGGRFVVRSEPGRGSTFSFEIDLPPAEGSGNPAPDWSGLRGKRILIADENPTYRRILSRHLSAVGCEAFVVEAAAEVGPWLQRNPSPDLILLAQPAGKNGPTERRTRRPTDVPVPAGVPVVLLTADDTPLADLASRASFAAVLRKPVRRQLLLGTVARACSPAPRPEPRGASAELRATADRHPRRILLVEDNPVNRRVALALLSRLGYSADVAANGVEAIHACRERQYDLVLMDVRMPELDGLEATRRVRQLPCPQPKIFALTANAMNGDREKCLAAGMDDYIAKPVTLEDLQRAIAA